VQWLLWFQGLRWCISHLGSSFWIRSCPPVPPLRVIAAFIGAVTLRLFHHFTSFSLLALSLAIRCHIWWRDKLSEEGIGFYGYFVMVCWWKIGGYINGIR
jgi:hypothetical protein